jgi:hypothetical protein
MKSVSFIALIFTSLVLTSYTHFIEIDDVVFALKSGNASQLSRYFDTRVDISLPDKSDNYSRTQAEMILRNFFSNSGVTNFEAKYKGESNGTKYCIGTLQTRNAAYRTKLFMKEKAGKHWVQEITFQVLE